MISETGETSSFAATRGRSDFPTADAPAKTWLAEVALMADKMRGVSFSGRNPLRDASSVTRTLVTPAVFETSDATDETFDPATRQTTSPPIFVAAVTVLRVNGDSFSLLWSTMTKLLANLQSCILFDWSSLLEDDNDNRSIFNSFLFVKQGWTGWLSCIQGNQLVRKKLNPLQRLGMKETLR